MLLALLHGAATIACHDEHRLFTVQLVVLGLQVTDALWCTRYSPATRHPQGLETRVPQRVDEHFAADDVPGACVPAQRTPQRARPFRQPSSNGRWLARPSVRSWEDLRHSLTFPKHDVKDRSAPEKIVQDLLERMKSMRELERQISIPESVRHEGSASKQSLPFSFAKPRSGSSKILWMSASPAQILSTQDTAPARARSPSITNRSIPA